MIIIMIIITVNPSGARRPFLDPGPCTLDRSWDWSLDLGYICTAWRLLVTTWGPSWDILRPSWSYLRNAGGLLGSKVTLLKCPNRFRSTTVQPKCVHATRKCIHKTHGKWKMLILHLFYKLFWTSAFESRKTWTLFLLVLQIVFANSNGSRVVRGNS